MKKQICVFFIFIFTTILLFAADHSGTISSDETWQNYAIHYITGDVTVSDGVTLTIESGSEVRFYAGCNLYINGTLIANGSPDNGITFTSTTGGNFPGYWNQINFSGADAGSILDYCVIYYGGGSNPMIYVNNSGSNVEITNCDIQHSGNTGVYLYDNNSLTISDCQIKNNSGDGIYCAHTNTSPAISSCTISDNDGYGINNNASDNITINGCTIQNNGSYAIRTIGGAVQNITGSMNISGNNPDAILVESDNISGTWLNHDVPYVLDGNMNVANSSILTIEAGNSLKFNGDYYLYVAGTIVANGNSSNRIAFTSNQTSPSPGYWRYIQFVNPDNHCYFSYCDISYGGYYGSGYEYGMIYDESSSSTYRVYFNNCNIEQSQYSAVVLSGDISPSFINCVIKDNDGYGIKINDNASHPTFGSSIGEWNDMYNNNGGGEGRSFRNGTQANTVEYIYWGTTVESEIQAKIYNYNSVDYTPWINASHDHTLSVVLSVFTAQYINNTATVHWKTQSETGNMGWLLYRNDKNDFSSSENISGMIEGHGTTTQQQSYVYEDTIENSHAGDTYYYWLESIDFSGIINSYDMVAMLTVPEHEEPGNSVEVPARYGLFQNEPNPFVSSTKIAFNLPNTAQVTLSVYNISGQFVKTMYSGSSQNSSFVWDGKDEIGKKQRNGIYLYMLEVDGKIYGVKKMILMK